MATIRAVSVSELSESAQDYLKVIWGLQEWSDVPVTASTIAGRLGVKLSTVSGAVSRLTDQGLLEHAPYGAVTLTDRGRTFAVAMVRRHRLIEAFLVQVLQYRWDQVHDEAERLEHAVSDFLIERMDALLGHPTRDPHGDPIPGPDGTVSLPHAAQLTSVTPGGTVTVERISDADPKLLQYFARHGIVVGSRLRVRPGPPYSEALEVTVDEGDSTVSLGRAATNSVWVSSPGPGAGGLIR